MNTSMKLCDSVIKNITALKLFENYMSTSGRISWDSYKEKVSKATLIQSGLELSPRWLGFTTTQTQAGLGLSPNQFGFTTIQIQANWDSNPS